MIFKVGLVLLSIFALSKAACTGEYAKYANFPGHSACVAASESATNIGVSDSDKTLIVNKHNTIRRAVDPAATDMMKMSWDDEIAFIAQAWASSCILDHDENSKRVALGKSGLGQNLAMNATTWTAAVDAWESENDDFNYGQSTTKTVGHYTQVVWAKSSKIGCGYAYCGNTHYHVCNYGPAGNNRATLFTPWTSGSSCGACSSNCDDKLCSCSNGCYNDGAFNLADCSCTCVDSFYGGKLPFYNAPDCALNCTSVQQPGYCGSFFTKEKCATVSNAKTHCPVTCSICPSS